MFSAVGRAVSVACGVSLIKVAAHDKRFLKVGAVQRDSVVTVLHRTH